MKKYFIIILLICANFIFFTGSCYCDGNIEYSLQAIRSELNEISDSNKKPYSSAIKDYFNYYSLEFPNCEHEFGYIETQGYKITVHKYIPSNPRQSVFVVHGLYDHVGIVKNIIGFLLENNYVVVAYDLPGHGLSTGVRVSIDDFSTYADIFDDIVKRFSIDMPKPLTFIGHSTGCSVFYEYLQKNKINSFEKIIFLAPLIHSKHWILSKIAYFITNPLVKSVKRRNFYNSSDRQFNMFVKKDPLQYDRVPLTFVKALFTWNENIEKYKNLNQSILIIQGDKDKIVDSKYNIPFLQSKIEGLEIHYINGAMHQLMNESQPIKRQVFDYIAEYLKKGRQ